MSRIEWGIVALVSLIVWLAIGSSGWHWAVRLPLVALFGGLCGFATARTVQTPWRRP